MNHYLPLLLVLSGLFPFCFLSRAVAGMPGDLFPVAELTTLDTSLVPADKLLPNIVGDTLFVLQDVPVCVDSLHTLYRLHNVQATTVQELVIPGAHVDRTRLVEYFVGPDMLTLVHLFGIVIFNREGNLWQFSRAYQLEHPVSYALKDGNMIYLWNDNMPARKLGSNFYSLSFDLDKGEVVRVDEFPKPAGARFMAIRPRNVLTRTARTIAIADISSYTICVYNADLSACDTLIAQPHNWLALSGEVNLPNKGAMSVYNLPAIDSLARAVSLISRLTFIDDSTLLVLRSTPLGGEVIYHADVWSRREGVWDIAQQNLPFHSAIDSVPYSLPLSAMSAFYTYRNGVFFEFAGYPLDYRRDYYWTSYADYRKESRRYFSNYAAQYTLVARRYTPDKYHTGR